METTIQTLGCVSGHALAGFRGVANDILMRSENEKAEKLADEVAKHFWPMIGTANQVAYEAIDEAVEEMRADDRQESYSSAGNCQADEQTVITQLSRP